MQSSLTFRQRGGDFSSQKDTPFFQAKLTVNQPGDAYEQEADTIADQVMRTTDSVSPTYQKVPISSLQRKCAACEEEEKVQRKEEEDESLQRKEASNTSPTTAPESVSRAIAGTGQPLDSSTRHFMESRMGEDFGEVQIHTDHQAAASAQAINALAYTSGHHIVFNEGQYQPHTDSGKRLLAHELVHTKQQGGGIKRKTSPPSKNHHFSHHGVRVVIRQSCDASTFGTTTVETAFKQALDAIFNSDCIEASRRKAMQINLRKNGYDVRCLDSSKLHNVGACAESTGFSIPANIMTLGSNAFSSKGCGNLASTILHEIVHVVRGSATESLSDACEASCFGFGSGNPDLCKK